MKLPSPTSYFSRLRDGLTSDVVRAATRFPIPTLAAVLVTAYFLLDLHHPGRLNDTLQSRVPIWLGLLFPASLAAALFMQSRGWPQLHGAIAGVAAGVVLALLVAFSDALDLDPTALFAALAGLVGVAAFAGAAENARYWQFNHHLWTGLAFSLIAIVLFFGGVSAIIETLRYLFAIQIPYAIHEKLWIVAWGLVAPLNWLSLVPERFDAAVPEGEQTEFTSRAVAALVKYILVPLLVVYAVILHVYALKILFEMTLPKGRLGWMVLSYAAVMALTALLSFPTRSVSGPLVRQFWRYWPLMLIVPALLLFLAASARISQYGVTEQRYLVLLAGVWIVVLVVTQGFSSERRDLKLIAATQVLLLLGAAFGPWGAAGVSNRSQLREFTGRLEATGLAENGVLKANAPAADTISLVDRARLGSIIEHLSQRRRLSLLRPLFTGSVNDPFATIKASPPRRIGGGLWTADASEHELARAIKARLGLPANTSSDRGGASTVFFNVAGPYVFENSASGMLVGPLSYWLNDKGSNRRPFKAGERSFEAEIIADGVRILEPVTAREARFEFSNPLTLQTAMSQSKPPPGPGSGESKATAYHWKRDGGTLDVEIVVTNATALIGSDGKVALRSITMWLKLAP